MLYSGSSRQGPASSTVGTDAGFREGFIEASHDPVRYRPKQDVVPPTSIVSQSEHACSVYAICHNAASVCECCCRASVGARISVTDGTVLLLSRVHAYLPLFLFVLVIAARRAQDTCVQPGMAI